MNKSTECKNKSTEAYYNHFMKEEMNAQDWSNATESGALMVGLRNSTMLKNIALISENATYLELIAEIRRHIEAEKTSNLEASKLSQEVLLGGKRKLDYQISTSKPNNNMNDKKSRNGNQGGNNEGHNNRNVAL